MRKIFVVGISIVIFGIQQNVLAQPEWQQSKINNKTKNRVLSGNYQLNSEMNSFPELNYTNFLHISRNNVSTVNNLIQGMIPFPVLFHATREEQTVPDQIPTYSGINLNELLLVHRNKPPEPKEILIGTAGYDIGNIVQLSPGSWIHLNNKYSFVMDLPLYFYTIQEQSNDGFQVGKNKYSIVEKSVARGEILPLIYQIKLGMGIVF